MGYALYARGSWKGDMLIADAEEQENLAPEVSVKRIKSQEVLFVKEGDNFVFPCANGM